MEDDLHLLEYGRQPQYFGKWKTTRIIFPMEDDLNFWKMEENLNYLENEKRPTFENNLANEKEPQ
jgi:hypothetical protein